jgi:hypothetical protein
MPTIVAGQKHWNADELAENILTRLLARYGRTFSSSTAALPAPIIPFSLAGIAWQNRAGMLVWNLKEKCTHDDPPTPRLGKLHSSGSA